MITNEKTSVAYQFLCMDADGYARTGDICLKFEDAVKDVRARSAGLARPDKQQYIKVLITHFLPVEEW